MAKQRNPNSLIWKSIETSSTPTYLLDESFILRFANSAFWSLVPPESQQLLGKRLGRIVSADARAVGDLLAAALLPPPDLIDQPVARFTLLLPAVGPQAGEAEGAKVAESRWQAHWTWIQSPDAGCYFVTLHPPPSAESVGEPRVRELQEKWLESRRRWLTQELPVSLLGESTTAGVLREQITTAQKVNANLQIIAATGSGEEQVARFIHQGRHSALRGPLVALECTLLDAELLQTTLRELVRSSQDEGVGRGCLLLLNVDRLVESGQVELLNLLSFPQVLFTTIVTTQRSLLELSADGMFSPDLAARLAILSLRLPRLHERVPDLPEILHAQLQLENRKRVEPVSGFSDEALQRLVRYPWPRNLEQLQEVVELAVLAADGPWVESNDLPRYVRRDIPPPEDGGWELNSMNLESFLNEVESLVIQQALRQCQGNKTKAAQLLGMTRATFHRKVDAMEKPSARGVSDGT